MTKKKVSKKRKYVYRKKKGVMRPYISKRNKDDSVKIWWWREERMSYEGIKRIPKKFKRITKPIVYKKDIRVDVPPELLSSKEKIEDLAINTLGIEGNYLLMMFCHAKNSFGVSPKKVARVIIKKGGNGLDAEMTHNYRLSRYWFWNKK